jgi:hypothetical protein
MDASWLLLVVLAAPGDGCTPSESRDHAQEIHIERNPPKEIPRLLELVRSGASYSQLQRELGDPFHLSHAEAEATEAWWVYGAHRKGESCTGHGAWQVDYFTNYDIFVITHREGELASCRWLRRVYITPDPHPNPLIEASAEPWDQEHECSAVET